MAKLIKRRLLIEKDCLKYKEPNAFAICVEEFHRYYRQAMAEYVETQIFILKDE